AVLASAVAAGVKPPKPRAAWRRLEAGLELGEFVSPRPSDRGDSIVRALRIEPSRFELRLLNASANARGGPLTARAWCARARLVQSIRMISCNGENVWSRQERRWSTAAIGMDALGRILFLHVRSPYSTHDLIDILKALPLGLTRAMYAEGGPEAQLFVSSGAEEHEWVGSYA